MLKATPAKLKDGTWGARVAGVPKCGDVINVETKAGKSWTARVVRVLWKGDGVASVQTESLDRPTSRRQSREDAADLAEDMGHFGVAERIRNGGSY